ncbi:MAG: hypothetical protein F4232_00490 [Acidimicrobiaceae bacterium]|nr:hypothetical protein [Acidimicrobiaceae bacterium]
MLRAGSTQLQLEADITRDMITVISGLVVACVAARLLLSRRAARLGRGRDAGLEVGTRLGQGD